MVDRTTVFICERLILETDNRDLGETVVTYIDDPREYSVSIPFALDLVENALENSTEDGSLSDKVRDAISVLRNALKSDDEEVN